MPHGSVSPQREVSRSGSKNEEKNPARITPDRLPHPRSTPKTLMQPWNGTVCSAIIGKLLPKVCITDYPD